MPQSKCILCARRLKLHNRRSCTKPIIKYLKKNFLLDASSQHYLCSKCSFDAHSSNNDTSKVVCNNLENAVTTNDEVAMSTFKSPPSVRLAIKSASKSHAYCFICKKNSTKLVTVPVNIQTDAFIKYNVIITADSRCCQSHFNTNLDAFLPQDIDSIKTHQHTNVSRSTIIDLLSRVRNVALQTYTKQLSFDSLSGYTNDDLVNLTGLNKSQFLQLYEYVYPHVRNTPARNPMTSLAIFLFKLRSGTSNKIISTVFRISKSSTRRAIQSVRHVLMQEFVPENLGFNHISREDILQNHTRHLAQSLLAENNSQVILVLDGTYIYIEKSNNFQFQRRSYSVHKGRPLVKPMVVVTTTGYFVSVLGPYFANSKNNDACILKHILNKNIEEIKNWILPSDIFVVDRGFRDSIELLNDLGIKAEMPKFLNKNQKQHSCEDANTSRLVTKVRWVVEAANGRIKQWRYLNKVLPCNQVPFIGQFVKIVCAISNKFFKAINPTKHLEEDIILADQMKLRMSFTNSLQQYIIENNLEKRSISKWVNVEDCNVENFPILDEPTLRLITLGTYQLKLCSSYIQEYIGGDCSMQLFQEAVGLLRVRLQSRHISSKTYLVWIQYDEDHIKAWYCKCRAGARTVGTCSHVAAVLWYLGQELFSKSTKGVKNWGDFLDDAAEIIEVADSSESSDGDSCIEE